MTCLVALAVLAVLYVFGRLAGFRRLLGSCRVCAGLSTRVCCFSFGGHSGRWTILKCDSVESRPLEHSFMVGTKGVGENKHDPRGYVFASEPRRLGS